MRRQLAAHDGAAERQAVWVAANGKLARCRVTLDVIDGLTEAELRSLDIICKTGILYLIVG